MTKEAKKIEYYPAGSLNDIGFVSVYAKHRGQWVFCLHKQRQKWECPGGHVEEGEDALDAAKRELYEETGAVQYRIIPLWDYSFSAGSHSNHGRVYFADVYSFGELPSNEMEKIGLYDDLPEIVTYERDSMLKNLERVEKMIQGL